MTVPALSTLLLRGGHRWACAPAEAQGILAYLAGARPDPQQIFTVRGPDGQTLTIPAREIVGVVGEEPAQAAPASHFSAWRKETGLSGSPYVLIDDFLAPADLEKIVAFALAQESVYAAATVTDTAEDYRSAKVLFDLTPVLDLFVPRVRAMAPEILRQLNLPPVTIKNIECQLTAHGDGDFFRRHNDNGSRETAGRALTYVYYFNRTPKAFAGGLLRMYETVVENGFYTGGKAFHDIEPRCNSLIMFPSHCQHEVTAVSCPSGRFADRRFTVNGWVVRAS